MIKSRELVILEHIEDCSKSLYGIYNPHALYYCEMGLIMQVAEVYDEFEKFRRSLCDYLPLINYADIDFKEWSEKVYDIGINLEEALSKENCNLRRQSYSHLDTLINICSSEVIQKTINFGKLIKFPNLQGKEVGNILASIFYRLSSLMEEIYGLLRYPEIHFYEDFYYKIYSICESELDAIEQNLSDEIKLIPQRSRLDYIYNLSFGSKGKAYFLREIYQLLSACCPVVVQLLSSCYPVNEWTTSVEQLDFKRTTVEGKRKLRRSNSERNT